MSTDTVSEQILQNVKTSLEAADLLTFADVQRLNDAGGVVSRYPCAQIWVSGDTTVGTDLWGSIDADVRSMRLVVRVWVCEFANMPAALTTADGAVTRALHLEPTRGDLARHTQRTGAVHFAPEDGTGVGYIDVAFDVNYAVDRVDPGTRL